MNTIFVSRTKIWNLLPSDLKSIYDLENLKKPLKMESWKLPMSTAQSIFKKYCFIWERNKIGIILLETFWTMFWLTFGGTLWLFQLSFSQSLFLSMFYVACYILHFIVDSRHWLAFNFNDVHGFICNFVKNKEIVNKRNK